MGLTGVDRVVFGVEDLAAAKRFLDDWGLTETEIAPDSLLYATRDGAEVADRHHLDPMLPPAMQPGATLREVVWGVSDDAQLHGIAERVGDSASLHMPRVTDPNGLSHAFRTTCRRSVVAE